MAELQLHKIKKFTMDEALEGGSDLWVLSENSSAHFRRLDWFLNFQLSRTLLHKSPEIPLKIQQLIEQCQLPQFDFIEKSICLIGSQGLLPCRWVLLTIAPADKNAQGKWFEETQSTAVQLGAKQLRFFPSSAIQNENIFSKVELRAELKYSWVSTDKSSAAQWL
jgi:hypothetical protein